MLDDAFETLKKFDWGSDLNTLSAIEDAVVASHDKPEIKQDLEKRMVVALNSDLSRDAKEYLCRKLAVIGTSACVSALATMLTTKEGAHMARFALERIPAPESSQALRDALPKVGGDLKIGVISSLGSQRDAAAVPALGALLKDGDAAIARSAALALGNIGSTEAVAALQSALQASSLNPTALVDALLGCAESLLASNKRSEASAIYKVFAQEKQPRLVRLAGMRGLLACAGKQA